VSEYKNAFNVWGFLLITLFDLHTTVGFGFGFDAIDKSYSFSRLIKIGPLKSFDGYFYCI
jgi:hypothetical protein